MIYPAAAMSTVENENKNKWISLILSNDIKKTAAKYWASAMMSKFQKRVSLINPENENCCEGMQQR